MLSLIAQSGNNALNYTAIVVAAIGVIGSILTYMQASHTRRDQRKQADRTAESEGYRRAREFDRQTIEYLSKENERLMLRIEEERNESSRLKEENSEVVDELIRKNRKLEALESDLASCNVVRERVADLEERLRVAMAQLRSVDGRSSKSEIWGVVQDVKHALHPDEEEESE